MHDFINFIKELVGSIGYLDVFLMMTLESSFIPFPSEIAMIPAGYLVSIGKMNAILALLAGTMGAILGASINYFLGKHLGSKIVKKLIKKFGKYFFLSLNHYDKAEVYFKKHGSITTFLARFIPAVRQLISIPAGIFKMNYLKFIVYTGAGALIWNTILVAIGYMAGENEELINKYAKEALIGILLFGIFVGVSYYFKQKNNES